MKAYLGGKSYLEGCLFRRNPILALVVLDIVFCMRGILQKRCFEGCGSLKEKHKNIKRKI